MGTWKKGLVKESFPFLYFSLKADYRQAAVNTHRAPWLEQQRTKPMRSKEVEPKTLEFSAKSPWANYFGELLNHTCVRQS